MAPSRLNLIRLLPWQLLWVSEMGFFEVVVLLIQRYYKFFLEGCKNTIILAFFSVALGALGGTLLSLMRMSKFKVLKYPAVAIVEFVRGTPLMVQLMFIFYGLPMIGVTFPDISFIPNFSRFMAGVVAMSLNSSAYVSEIIRNPGCGPRADGSRPFHWLHLWRVHEEGCASSGCEEYSSRPGK